MIPIPSGVRVWIATGHTDMRRGMQSLALTVQESLKRDPHAGDLYIFRGRRGDLAKILWHDGIRLSLYAKRLDRGKFIWPSASAWRGVDLGGADGLYAGRDRLEKSATDMAAAERGLSEIKYWSHAHFRAPQITESMIYFVCMDADSRRSSRRHSRSERGVGDRAREGAGYCGGARGRPGEGVGRQRADCPAETCGSPSSSARSTDSDRSARRG